MKSFDEWLDTTKLRGYMDENSLEAAWEAGQQSKQAEVDELQKRIENQVENLKLASKSWVYTEREQNIMISQADDLEKILKGKTNEQ